MTRNVAIFWGMLIFAAILLLLSAGCSSFESDIRRAAEQHRAHLIETEARIDSARSALDQEPPAVDRAKSDLTGAKSSVTKARTSAEQIEALARSNASRLDEVHRQFWSPLQRKIALTIGIIVALVGIIIALVRFGGFGGTLLSIPILGVILLKLGLLEASALPSRTQSGQ